MTRPPLSQKPMATKLTFDNLNDFAEKGLPAPAALPFGNVDHAAAAEYSKFDCDRSYFLSGGTMKKLLAKLMISAFCFASHSALSAQSTRSQAPVSKASNTNCAVIKFHTLSRYKGERWWKVFSDREIAPALRALLKRDYGLLKESLKEVAYPEDSLSYLDKNGVLTLAGGVRGLHSIMEAKLIIEPCGNIYAAILDDGERFFYFTNDRKHIDKLPPAIEQWWIKIESSRSQPSAVPKLPVVFKNK